MDFAISIIEQGLIYGILALGVYITYKILDFPDLTVDGSFPLGSSRNSGAFKIRRKPLSHTACGIFCRGSSRTLHRSYSCKM